MARKKKGDSVKAVKVTLEDLNDEEVQALLEQHKEAYEEALESKRSAATAFLNVCKRAKADLGKNAVDMIRDAIELDTPEGEARFKADLERKFKVARWVGSEALAGTQFDLFSREKQTSVERAAAEGRRNGMTGRPLKTDYAPGTPEYDAFVDAHHNGVKEASRIQRKRDAADFDTEAPIGDAPATFQTH